MPPNREKQTWSGSEGTGNFAAVDFLLLPCALAEIRLTVLFLMQAGFHFLPSRAAREKLSPASRDAQRHAGPWEDGPAQTPRTSMRPAAYHPLNTATPDQKHKGRRGAHRRAAAVTVEQVRSDAGYGVFWNI